MDIRTIKSTDYPYLYLVINHWWGGRNMADMLPKLFFDHFTKTSFVVEENSKIIGFLIGFLSQTHPDEAYIHFVGVHPDYRKQNVGSTLYHQFFKVAQEHNRMVVRCVTSPVNTGSISYHTKMGFDIVIGDQIVNGTSVHTNYDGHGQSRVLFIKNLED